MSLKDLSISKKEIIILIIVFVCVLLIPFIVISFWTKGSFNNTGIIGDTIGGMTAPFLSFLGSVLVYFALKSQIDANTKITEQFKEQNQDQLFFRLVDNLHARINNYSLINPDKVEIRSYETLKSIVDFFQRKMDEEAVYYGRELLCSQPSIIDLTYYYKIVHIQTEIGVYNFENAEIMKQNLMDIEVQERWDYLKIWLGGRNYEKPKQRDVLRSIGSVYFYKTAFSNRQEMYNNVYHESINKFGGFLDGYFNVLEYLFKTISKIKENEFYLDYIKNQFTRYEKLLIFYYIASDKSSVFFKSFVIQNGFLLELHHYSSNLIDLPSQNEIENEINQIRDSME